MLEVVAAVVALILLAIAGAGVSTPLGGGTVFQRKRDVLRGRPRPGQQASDDQVADDAQAWADARARRRS